MPTTTRRQNANRQNAQKSTGPRTPEGKAVSSRNAITHGLHAVDIVIDSPHLKESRLAYEQLVQSLADELQPNGTFQEHLVVKIANCMWRYRRAINAETALIRHRLDCYANSLRFKSYLSGNDEDSEVLADLVADPDETDDGATLVNTREIACHARCIPTSEDSKTILLYEMRLDRQIARAYALLNHLKRPESASTNSKGTTTDSTRFDPYAATVDSISRANTNTSFDNHPNPINPDIEITDPSLYPTINPRHDNHFDPTTYGRDAADLTPWPEPDRLSREKNQNEPISPEPKRPKPLRRKNRP